MPGEVDKKVTSYDTQNSQEYSQLEKSYSNNFAGVVSKMSQPLSALTDCPGSMYASYFGLSGFTLTSSSGRACGSYVTSRVIHSNPMLYAITNTIHSCGFEVRFLKYEGNVSQLTFTKSRLRLNSE